MANSIFFKTLSKSINTSNMIKGGDQGGLKRKKLLTPSICAIRVGSQIISLQILKTC